MCVWEGGGEGVRRRSLLQVLYRYRTWGGQTLSVRGLSFKDSRTVGGQPIISSVVSFGHHQNVPQP